MNALEKLVLTLPNGVKEEFVLSKASVTVGRATVNDIVLRDTKVSRFHARVERGPRGFELVDLGSVNGVRVNGKPANRALLEAGDVVDIGDAVFAFEVDGAARDAEVTRIDSIDDLQATLADTPLSVQLEETSVPRIAVHTKDRTWEVEVRGDVLTIGRHSGSDIVVDSRSVSRNHAVIERRGDQLVLRDLNSGNGTWMRHERVASIALHDSDTFRIGPATLVFKGGVDAEDLATIEEPLAERRRIVVIPGFAGSTLWRGSEQVWPAPRRLLTDKDLLRIDVPLEARALVGEIVIIPNLLRQEQYSSLTDYLKETLGYESGDDLLEFAYDFRQDNRESARQLAAAIDAWEGSGPITIIAHSMGCLIGRYFVERLGGSRVVERIIYIGAPHLGTPYAFASLLEGPGLLPLGLLNERLRDLLASFPSWYQILPNYRFASDGRSNFDVLADESWMVERHRPLLRSAREFRRELGTKSSVPAVCVFGYGFKTITGAVIDRQTSGLCDKADMQFTLKGDGMIPESSALMPGAEIHPVGQRHGALHGNTDVKMRLKLELTRRTPGA